MIASTGGIAYTVRGIDLELLNEQTVATKEGSGAFCRVQEGGVLSCSTGRLRNVLQLCLGQAITNDIFIDTVQHQDCAAETLLAEPVCTPPVANAGGGKQSR